ncbi:MAG: FAD-binding protein [Betaproteobacteria bacterium]
MVGSIDKRDLVIVGCGIAGTSAAVTALQAGRSVVMLERAPEEDFGGNSRWTEAYLRMKNDAEVSDDFEERFAQNAGVNLDPNVLDAVAGEYAHWPPYVKAHPLPDPELIAHFAASVPTTIAWLKGLGLRFGPQPIYLLTQSTTRIAAQGGGLALIERLMKEARALGAEVRFRTTAVDLLRDEDGSFAGVKIVDPEGRHGEVRARATLLASGGYQGNPEMMAHYMGWRAAPAGDFSSYHAVPVDPRSRQPEAVVHIYPYGILVNKLGLRFVNEAPGMVDAWYDPITRTIAEQPDGIAWVILDARVDGIPRWKTAIRSDVPPVEAPTLDGLIDKLGLPAAALQTVEDFNRACPPETSDFKPFELDHRAARDLRPAKSHWCRPIDRAPFRAFPIISANCFTFGGLKVDTHARVLDNEGKVMPGPIYTGATSVLRGAVFGRTAAQHAAEEKRAVR